MKKAFLSLLLSIPFGLLCAQTTSTTQNSAKEIGGTALELPASSGQNKACASNAPVIGGNVTTTPGNSTSLPGTSVQTIPAIHLAPKQTPTEEKPR